MNAEKMGTSAPNRRSARDAILNALQAAPGSPFRVSDIRDAPPAAVVRAFSRLAEEGTIRRLRKGVYYLPKETLLGISVPPPSAILQKMLPWRSRPTGVTAANVLGMSTQVAGQAEFAVRASARPRGMGSVRLRIRPRTRDEDLDVRDAALLEFLRERGRYGELSPTETCDRARAILVGDGGRSDGQASPDRLTGLRDAAIGEPPRVRAIVGALMQSAGLPQQVWRPLRESLNPLSRFDFGPFRVMANAKEWQAK